MTAACSGRRSALPPSGLDALDSLREHCVRVPMPGERAGVHGCVRQCRPCAANARRVWRGEDLRPIQEPGPLPDDLLDLTL